MHQALGAFIVFLQLICFSYAEIPFLPRTFLINPTQLVETRARVQRGDPALIPAMKNLVSQAEFCLAQGPFSVMQKNMTAPTGDKHDFFSTATYYWPCYWNSSNIPSGCNLTTGVPWVDRDGVESPWRHEGDNYPLGYMSTNVSILAYAYWFTGDEKYAQKAAELIQVWFLNNATYMNPNMEYSQFVPGAAPLSGGIIDARYFIDSGGTIDIGSTDKTIGGVLNAAPLLYGSPYWSLENEAQLRAWFSRYLEWLLTSSKGKTESRQPNNHGTWYDVQCTQAAYYVGNYDVASAIAQNFSTRRIASQILPNGTLPYELARTKALWYEFFALAAFWDVAGTSVYVGIDLWYFNTSDGRNLRNALNFIAPYFTGTPWPYSQIIPMELDLFFSIFRRASIAYDSAQYEQMIPQIPGVDYEGDLVNLLFPRVYF